MQSSLTLPSHLQRLKMHSNHLGLMVSLLSYILHFGHTSPLITRQFSVNRGSFSRDTNTALISLILKKDKDPSACSNYWPLSLLNTEVKLFPGRKTGSIDDRFGAPWSDWLLKISFLPLIMFAIFIEGASSISTPCTVLPVDAEKVFDCLEWQYLQYGRFFTTWVLVPLYLSDQSFIYWSHR